MESSIETHTGTHELGVVRRDLRSVWFGLLRTLQSLDLS